MKLRVRPVIFGALAGTLLGLVTITSAAGQATPTGRPAAARPLLAEQIYRNIRVLRGLTVDEFLDTMGFISSALGTNCTHCHDEAIGSGDASRHQAFEIETPLFLTARKMITMVDRINTSYFGGAKVVTCYTCHRGLEDPPKVIPQLALQYGEPKEEEPNQFTSQDPNSPSPDQILDRYIQAIGGAERVGAITSFVGTGTYTGYDTDLTPVPMNLYAKSPDQRTLVMHTPFGDRSEIFNGTAGWTAVPDTSSPRPVLDITGGRLVSVKVTAQLAFPMQVKTALTRWLSGPMMTISSAEPGASNATDREVYVIQGNNTARLPVKLYFDKDTYMLVRVVSYINTALGLIPAQVDYSDFREVAGVKMPHHWVNTWTDGQSIFNLSEIRANVPIEASMFARPAPPRLLTPVMQPGATR